MQATNRFHGFEKIPNGATLKVKAYGIAGNVQATALYMPGSQDIPDQEWSLGQMEAGTSQAVLQGPDLVFLRIIPVIDGEGQASFCVTVEDNGQEIRNIVWDLESDSPAASGHIGVIVDVEEAKDQKAEDEKEAGNK